MNLHIVGEPLRIAWQLHCVQRSPWPTVNQHSTEHVHKARAYAFLDDTARLNIARGAPVLDGETLRSGDDALWHADSMPGMNRPAIAIAHTGTRLAVQPSGCIDNEDVCNRAPGLETSIPEISEFTPIPGNIRSSEGQKAARVREIFRPYHDRIKAELDRRR